MPTRNIQSQTYLCRGRGSSKLAGTLLAWDIPKCLRAFVLPRWIDWLLDNCFEVCESLPTNLDQGLHQQAVAVDVNTVECEAAVDIHEISCMLVPQGTVSFHLSPKNF